MLLTFNRWIKISY